MTNAQYISFLIATRDNFTGTFLAEHLDPEMPNSHDTVTDFLARNKITPRDLYNIVRDKIKDSTRAFLIVDDSVQSKKYSKHIELTHRQYSGNEKRTIQGIGIVNLIHSDSKQFWPVDYRIHDGLTDGKTKHDHFRDMLIAAKQHKQIQAQTVLFDEWYTASQTLKLIHSLEMVFVAPLKHNRSVSRSVQEGYQRIDTLCWTPQELQNGISIKVKELHFRLTVFKLPSRKSIVKVASCSGGIEDLDDRDVEYVATNRPIGSIDAAGVQRERDIRWQIELLHRDLKQLVGIERCQCRKERSQRNHIGLSYQAWVALRVRAQQLGTTLYALHRSLLKHYLIAELQNPRIPVIRSTA